MGRDGLSGLGKAGAYEIIFPQGIATSSRATQAGGEQRAQHASTKTPELLRPAAGR